MILLSAFGMPGHIELLIVVGLVLASVLIAVIVLLAVRSVARRPPPPVANDVSIDLSRLPPPESTGEPLVDVWHTPMRLAVLIVAPLGRSGFLPAGPALGPFLDAALPGLQSVVERDRPIFRRWPPQLSASGFAQAVFGNVADATPKGAPSVWFVTAGVAEAGASPFLLAMALRSERPHRHGQLAVTQPGQWRDTVRIRPGARP